MTVAAPHTTSSTESPAAIAVADRVLALWFPDWSVAVTQRREGLGDEVPVALEHGGIVVAANAPARASGVRRGQKRRLAQENCAGLRLFPTLEDLDHRAFEPLITAIEAVIPAVQLVRPGLCLLPARGPVRYYGGEAEAAQVLFDAVEPHRHGRYAPVAGFADGVFAARRVATSAVPNADAGTIVAVPRGASRAFLAPLAVDVLGDPERARILHRLGVHTLGDYAALGDAAIRERFGAAGLADARIAAGFDPVPVRPRVAPADLVVTADFETPLDRADTVGFAVRVAAERFVSGLRDHALVATTVRIHLLGDRGTEGQRQWAHPRFFSAGDLVDRVRWQVQGEGGATRVVTEPIVAVRIEPELLADAVAHEPGLWGRGADEKIHHDLTRLQAVVGHAGVLTARVHGGRAPAERVQLTPWGDRPEPEPAGADWPGQLRGAVPVHVWPDPVPVRLLDAQGAAVLIDDRGELSGDPAQLVRELEPGHPLERARLPAHPLNLLAWNGPWPDRDRWWSGADPVYRFHVVDEAGHGWLLLHDGEQVRWEAAYD